MTKTATKASFIGLFVTSFLVPVATMVAAQMQVSGFALVYGGDAYAEGYAGRQTSDGGFVSVAYLASAAYPDGHWLLTKLDSTGAIALQSVLDDSSGQELQPYAIEETNDGGFIIAGTSYAGPQLVKTDSNGNVQWAKRYNANLGSFVSVRQTGEGGYVTAGWYFPSIQYAVALLVKFDSSGNVQWAQKTGGATTCNQLICSTYAESVAETSNGYIVSGYTDVYSGFNIMSTVVYAVSDKGSLLWLKEYSGGCGFSSPVSQILPLSGGDFLLAGQWSACSVPAADEFLAMKLDSAGNILWQKSYGYYGTGHYDNSGAISVAQTSDGAYVLGGFRFASATLVLGWLVKVDPSGNILTQHQFPISSYFNSVAATSDGGAIAIGEVSPNGSANPSAFILREDPSGNGGKCSHLQATSATAHQTNLTATAQDLGSAPVSVSGAGISLQTVPIAAGTTAFCQF